MDINNIGNNDLIGTIDTFGLAGQLDDSRQRDQWAVNQPTRRRQLLHRGALWYNGDFDGVDGLTNEDNTSLGSGFFSHIYDDFIVNGLRWLGRVCGLL